MTQNYGRRTVNECFSDKHFKPMWRNEGEAFDEEYKLIGGR